MTKLTEEEEKNSADGNQNDTINLPRLRLHLPTNTQLGQRPVK